MKDKINKKYEDFHQRDLLIMLIEETKKTNNLLGQYLQKNEMSENERITIGAAMKKYKVGRTKVNNLLHSGHLTRFAGVGQHEVLLSVLECDRLSDNGIL